MFQHDPITHDILHRNIDVHVFFAARLGNLRHAVDKLLHRKLFRSNELVNGSGALENFSNRNRPVTIAPFLAVHSCGFSSSPPVNLLRQSQIWMRGIFNWRTIRFLLTATNLETELFEREVAELVKSKLCGRVVEVELFDLSEIGNEDLLF